MKPKLRYLAVPAAALSTVAMTVSAWAFWSSQGGGSGTSTVDHLQKPTAITASLTGAVGGIKVDWTTHAAPGGGTVDHYDVTRSRNGAAAVSACGSPVSGGAAACNDTVSQDGSYTYTVKAVFRTWTASGASNALAVVMDNTPPTVPAPGVSAAVTYGTNPIFVTNEPLSLTTAATDAGTGVRSVTYYRCAGATGTCNAGNGTEIGSSTTAGGNYPVTWASPLPPDGPYRIVAIGRDNAGNEATSSATVVSVDTAPPTVSTPTVTG